MHIMRNPNTALQRYRAGYLKPGQPSSPWIRVATLSSVRLPALASSSTYRYKQAEVDNANIKCFDQWSRRSENPATPPYGICQGVVYKTKIVRVSPWVRSAPLEKFLRTPLSKFSAEYFRKNKSGSSPFLHSAWYFKLFFYSDGWIVKNGGLERTKP